MADYHAKKEAYETKLAQNPAENIAYIGQPKTHSQHSYSLSPAFDVTKNINLQVKYSKGFRMPTIDEIYFTFQHPDITIKPNVDLKPEIAKTKELAVTVHGQYGFISGSIFETKYTDFIDFVFRGLEDIERKSSRKWPVYQSMNRQNAKAEGIEINSVLKLGELVPAIDGTQVSYKMTRQKGRADGNIPMNAIQPDTSFLVLVMILSMKNLVEIYTLPVSVPKMLKIPTIYFGKRSKQTIVRLDGEVAVIRRLI